MGVASDVTSFTASNFVRTYPETADPECSTIRRINRLTIRRPGGGNSISSFSDRDAEAARKIFSSSAAWRACSA
jgi:hypothetical protein